MSSLLWVQNASVPFRTQKDVAERVAIGRGPVHGAHPTAELPLVASQGRRRRRLPSDRMVPTIPSDRVVMIIMASASAAEHWRHHSVDAGKSNGLFDSVGTLRPV
jgi:hypothetical protein